MHHEVMITAEILCGPELVYTWAGPCCLFAIGDEDDEVFFNITTWSDLAESCWRELRPELEICVCGLLEWWKRELLGVSVLALQVWNRNESAIPYLLAGSQVDEPY